jgi:hypothetical protein
VLVAHFGPVGIRSAPTADGLETTACVLGHKDVGPYVAIDIGAMESIVDIQ